jgi:hypothetical protein
MNMPHVPCTTHLRCKISSSDSGIKDSYVLVSVYRYQSFRQLAASIFRAVQNGSLVYLQDGGIRLLQNHSTGCHITGNQNYHLTYEINYSILNFCTHPLLHIGQEWGLSDECVSK